ncbi:MAG: galactokinase family protein [Isosphaeraceae bacterium]
MTTAPSNDDLRREVARRFPVRPAEVALVRSPYRVCPLGAHIDHQNGPVTAFALDRNVRLAFAPRAREVPLASLDFDGEVAFSLDDILRNAAGTGGTFPEELPPRWGDATRSARGSSGSFPGRCTAGASARRRP